jgi:hypothetical protein
VHRVLRGTGKGGAGVGRSIRRRPARRARRAASRPRQGCVAQLGDRRLELVALGLHDGEALAREVVGPRELGHALVADVVEVEQLADLLEREAEALALQDQRQPRTAPPGEEPPRALPDRREQFLRLVEAQGAGGDVEVSAHISPMDQTRSVMEQKSPGRNDFLRSVAIAKPACKAAT